ncbi:glycosyltransferase [Companilactobacillus hulinensis]|uniref:glycosyltransferase n=1 Tax=Companilactobacillus hulinensis TaxID=2486007 RepID=UPI000F7AF2BF|nr:glycosyltransferase [Companilactobacillus hulinensis]
MKVLEICEAYGGGVKRQVDYLNEFADTKDVEMITLVSSKRGAEIPKKYLTDDRLSAFPKHMFKYLSVLKCLHKLIIDKNIQLVHAHSTIAGITMVLYKMHYHDCPPIVFTPHAYFSEVDRGHVKNTILKIAEKFMSRHFAKVIHVSDGEQDYALANKLVTQGQSVVINNGVPFHEYEKVQHPATSFVNVARCSFQKNPQLFIKIAAKITKAMPNSNFTWVGDGPMLNECRAEVVRLGLSAKVHFIGYRNNPYKYLESSDVFFSTSRYEGQPFSVLEAISEKMPLLITDVIGHKELVDHNGILLTDEIINDSAKLTTAFTTVINDKTEFSDASYQLYEKKYNVMNMVDAIEAIYLSGVSGVAV